MYHGCILIVISMYLSCIMDVMEVVPHTSVFLHTLPITFLGPSLSRHPVLGISSPWFWLLVGEGSHGMAAPDMLFGRQGMHVPACPVGHCPAEIHMGPLHSMLQALHTGLLWGAKQGPKDSEKSQ